MGKIYIQTISNGCQCLICCVQQGVCVEVIRGSEPFALEDTALDRRLEVGVDDTPELGITLTTNNGNVVISGLADGTPVSCYTIDGRMLGKSSANGGTATFTAEPNSIVIVKVGKTTFKVYVK